MRTHGWAGATPADDDEAVARILDAARHRIDLSGADFGISDVAKDVGVTRQTVYRYFASTEALLYATAMAEVAPFLDSLAKHVRKIHDPAEAVVEGMAHTLDRLPHERYLGLLLTPGKASAYSAGVTSDASLSFGRALIDRYNVDWSSVGFNEEDLDGLVQFTLRLVQSLVIDPGRPPLRGKPLRDFLRRWIAPAITHGHSAPTTSAPPKRTGASTRSTTRRKSAATTPRRKPSGVG